MNLDEARLGFSDAVMAEQEAAAALAAEEEAAAQAYEERVIPPRFSRAPKTPLRSDESDGFVNVDGDDDQDMVMATKKLVDPVSSFCDFESAILLRSVVG